MEYKLKKWDIVEIKKFTEDSLLDNMTKINKSGGWLVQAHTLSNTPINFFLPYEVAGIKCIVYSFYGNMEHQICKVVSLDRNGEVVFRTRLYSFCSIPSSFLSKPLGRILDSRDLKFSAKSKFESEQKELAHDYNLTVRTKDLNLKHKMDILALRKRKQVFFPKKKMTLKEIMFNLLRYTNSSKNNLCSLSCPYCSAFIHAKSASTNRYVRKDGSMTCKCPFCGKSSFLSFSYDIKSTPTFFLTRKAI